jgi:hypothetical protein
MERIESCFYERYTYTIDSLCGSDVHSKKIESLPSHSVCFGVLVPKGVMRVYSVDISGERRGAERHGLNGLSRLCVGGILKWLTRAVLKTAGLTAPGVRIPLPP